LFAAIFVIASQENNMLAFAWALTAFVSEMLILGDRVHTK
jgi:hypothetical protein